ncbi:MAG: DoxX family protein [Planctomycetota bacterium]|jgi:hypothetical protein
MNEHTLMIALQMAVSLGLLNVWLARSRSATAYRGGDAATLRAEFAAYGLPDWTYYAVGALKVGAAFALVAGIWNPALIAPASGLIVLLMLAAITMHVKVRDPLLKSLPALTMLVMSAGLLAIDMA